MKECRKCKQQKPTSDYYKSNARTIDGLRHECKVCWNEAAKQYHQQTKHRRRNKLRDYRLRSEYGITLEDYNLMYQKQRGVCPVCSRSDKRLVVDHCHKTGRVRGLLCDTCNQALGSAYESKQILWGLMRYIDETH